MKNILILSKNYENYDTGYYHQDIIDTFDILTNSFLYGPGYPKYNKNDTFQDILIKLELDITKIDYIVFSTSWDEDGSTNTVDPHPKLDLSKINIPKIYFLNKEYKKLNLRFEYIKKQKMSLVCSVFPYTQSWNSKIDNIPIFNLPFGISVERFKDFNLQKEYDFSFTGNLHYSYNDIRFNIKKNIFNETDLHMLSNRGIGSLLKNPIRKELQKYKIFWAEWGSRNFFGKSLLPTGLKYSQFMNKTKVFLNTPSAMGIINTRFYELMATKSLILCPESESYGGILIDKQNCIMFKSDLSNFNSILTTAIEDNDMRKHIVNNAFKSIHNHTYINRIKKLLARIECL